MKHKKLIISISITIVLLVVLGGIEAWGTYHYNTHFYPNTLMMGENISENSQTEAYEKINANLNKYKLKITGEYSEDIIEGKDIDLAYKQNTEKKSNIFEQLLNQQKSYLWFLNIKKQHIIENDLSTKVDTQKVNDIIDSLSCFNPETEIEPVNAAIIFDEEKQEYTIQEEKTGNIPCKEKTKEGILQAISELKADYTIPKENYKQPDIKSTDQKIKNAFDTVSKYMSAKITLKDRSGSMVIDKKVIKDFIVIDTDLNVSINENTVTDYINKNLDKKFDTLYSNFSFKSPVSGEITMKSKTYGKVISTADELPLILEEIQNGESVNRKPVYKKTQIEVSDKNGGIGNNFIEVDISDQKVYVIRDGKIAFETSCVTGKDTSERRTPTGIFDVRLKARNYTMKKYNAHVKYWINVYPEVGVGLHDASWRSKFGGKIYKTNGSHGCINLPYDAVKKIYNMCDYFEPVIIHN